MKLSRLLENHQTAPSNKEGLPTNFGDAYLLSKNRIYKNIRAQALIAKFQFSLKKSEEALALPLSQLKTILESKLIPYTDNVSVLVKIEKQIPQSIDWDEIRESIKRNYLFHESCHAVAHANRKAHNIITKSEQNKCLWILLEESFANACELLALVDVEDAIHKIFYEINAYTFLNEERASLKLALVEVGDIVLLKVILLSYLFSNFLYEKINDTHFLRILKLVAPNKVFDSKQTKLLRSISKIAFTLDESFRQKTTSFYLKLCGFNVPPEKLFDFDFLSLIESDLDLKNHIDQIVKKALYTEASIAAE